MKTKNFDIFNQILTYIIKYFKWIVIAAVVLILLSGIYRVESNEVAVVLRFGRLVGGTTEEQIKQPGLHFSFPFFIDNVIKIPVQTVHEKTIITHYSLNGNVTSEVKSNGYLLTGDENVILIRAKVKYKIVNAVDYALYNCNPLNAIDGIVSGEMTQLITSMTIDTVLTSGKSQLSAKLIDNAQKIFDELETGILVTNVELTEIIPPAQTKQYFEEVITASVNKETAIQEARESASNMIIEAEAEANAYKQEALSEQSKKLTTVRSEMAEFDGVYDQYIRDPQVIISGTFRQRVSKLFAQMGGSVIIPDNSDSPIIVLP